ncbi:MAG: hypothetical protein ACK4SL_03515 [Candidatus Paceibacteria bacterium]
MSIRLALVTSLVAIFLIFATKPVKADPTIGHVIILGDQSTSMYPRIDEETTTLATLTDIVFQRVGITNALREFTPWCNSVRATYIAWGELQSQPISELVEPGKHFSDEFIAMIDDESDYPHGGTAHGAALTEGIRQVSATEPTALVFITNGAGKPVSNVDLTPVTVFKVSLFNEEVTEYLRDEFLPNEPHLVQAESAADVSLAVKAALQSVDTLCLG